MVMSVVEVVVVAVAAVLVEAQTIFLTTDVTRLEKPGIHARISRTRGGRLTNRPLGRSLEGQAGLHWRRGGGGGVEVRGGGGRDERDGREGGTLPTGISESIPGHLLI